MIKNKLRRVIATMLIGMMGTQSLSACSNDVGTVKLPDIKKEIKLWYDSPAPKNAWENFSLPIGNGYMGGGIYGGVVDEIITLNEKTLWTGGPTESRPDYNGGNRNSNSSISLNKVREALAAGDEKTALSLLTDLTGGGDGYGAYQLLCNLSLKHDGLSEDKVTDYIRDLDLNNSVASVSFNHDGFEYKREYFANYPDNVIVIRLTTGKEGGISFKMGLKDEQYGANIVAKGDTLTYSGELADNKLKYEAQFKVIASGGEVFDDSGNALEVDSADEVVIIMSAATDYENVYPNYRSGKDPSKIVTKAIKDAQKLGVEKLYDRHIEDYRSIFARVHLDLEDTTPTMPTNELLAGYQNNSLSESEARALETLYFQYGRYLLISSSREGSLPANLQGVWNNNNNPPWSSDYHINVNLQMNYWPAYVTNMAETTIPLVEYVEGLREPGRVTAAEYAGIVTDENNPENGWMAHTQSTPFGWTCPGWDFYWGWSAAASAWLVQNIWEHYEFTEDLKYLKSDIYPIMRESSMFYKQWLINDERSGRMVSSPTYSPEHGPVTIGNTYEQSLIEQLFVDTIIAADALETDSELRDEISKLIPKLSPYHIGEWGQIKEWYEEDDADFNDKDVEKGHRHISHLLGLYPGKAITDETPELLEAAKVTLNDRGDEATGWAKAHKLNLWARIGDGNRSHKLLEGLLQKSTLENLWDTHPPFQIDGNFGGTAGIAEMLIQSHAGYIEILPALPEVWSKGEVEGLVARGNFTVDIKWEDMKVTQMRIKSNKGNECKIKYDDIKNATITTADGKAVDVSNGEIASFNTKAGTEYIIKF